MHDNEQQQHRSCIAIDGPYGTACVHVGVNECQTCKAYCCLSHGPEHVKHAEWATEERLTAQDRSHHRISSSEIRNNSMQQEAALASVRQFRCIASTEDDICLFATTDLSSHCIDCNARICSLHGPEHAKHSYWATPEALAKQQAAMNSHIHPTAAAAIINTASRNAKAPSTGPKSSASTTDKLPAISGMKVDELKAELKVVHKVSDKIIAQCKTGPNLKELLKLHRALKAAQKQQPVAPPAAVASSSNNNASMNASAAIGDDDDDADDGDDTSD